MDENIRVFTIGEISEAVGVNEFWARGLFSLPLDESNPDQTVSSDVIAEVAAKMSERKPNNGLVWMRLQDLLHRGTMDENIRAFTIGEISEAIGVNEIWARGLFNLPLHESNPDQTVSSDTIAEVAAKMSEKKPNNGLVWQRLEDLLQR